MSWKKILKGKSSLSINQKAKEMIEDIMSDGKERRGIQVYDELWDKVEQMNLPTKQIVPTRAEVKRYVSALAKKGVFEVVGKTRPTKYVKKN